MRYFNLILFTLLLTIAACGDKEDLPNAKVIKDCNGTFIQIENTYYQVCNEDILSSVESGTELNLNVKHLDECKDFQSNEDCISIGPGPVLSGDWVEVIYTY